ncbi:lytic transglycosylase domain-containing protein [Ruixingdingia sedimenti]|uniref:Lytic transglycosylase domain-containing protein n=1 Tax=Ruixingdingia sedimenti TaxID=3073604 RepID=A0ABU1F2R3_9RHOB|nr:lytic transglycosylase domain-containing protein [Xinfangfangia sp. LG-4]MDR5651155.1 lytic transglycosylase domain-containing protein [Xinfangfangia sp. LG-4]
MPPMSRRTVLAMLASTAFLVACGDRPADRRRADDDLPAVAPGGRALHDMIDRAATDHGVPAKLVHRVVQRESRYNPGARNGPYYGLMQISAETARVMGYRGRPEGLLDARTNLHYGVKYLRGAWLVADRNHDRAVMWYARGYYYEAKRKGLLRETGLKS